MWIAEATVAEADGFGKYLISDPDTAGPTGSSVARRFVSEKKRERELADLRLQVVRWDTPDITRCEEEVARRVRAARAVGDIAAFRGHLRVGGEWVHLTEHALSGESDRQRGRFAG